MIINGETVKLAGEVVSKFNEEGSYRRAGDRRCNYCAQGTANIKKTTSKSASSPITLPQLTRPRSISRLTSCWIRRIYMLRRTAARMMHNQTSEATLGLASGLR